MRNFQVLIAMVVSLSPLGSVAKGEPSVQTRVSVTGAVFTRDRSNPGLGKAYLDPSGRLLWGDLVRSAIGNIRVFSQGQAENYCQSIGARLPTSEDFKKLGEYLGADYSSGDLEAHQPRYSPYTQDGLTPVLPGLARPGRMERWYRISSSWGGWLNRNRFFNANTGTFGQQSTSLATRCVMDR